MSDLYETLGVGKGADAATVKRAHRRKVAKVHPDKGGSKEEFLAVQLAYEVLSDEQRRRRYDETGDTSQRSENHLITKLVAIVTTAAEKFDPDTTDLVEASRKFITNTITELEREIATGTKVAERMERTAKRFTVRNDKPNVLSHAFLNRAAQARKRIAALQDSIDTHRAVLEVLADFEYIPDLPDVDVMVARIMGLQTRPITTK